MNLNLPGKVRRQKLPWDMQTKPAEATMEEQVGEAMTTLMPEPVTNREPTDPMMLRSWALTGASQPRIANSFDLLV